MLIKISSILLLFFGESLAIYIEVISAHQHREGLFWPLFLKLFLPIAIASGFILAGYMLGFQGFKDIWVVSVISIVSIIFMEPTINYLVFRELPGKGAALGLVFGMLGLVSLAIF